MTEEEMERWAKTELEVTLVTDFETYTFWAKPKEMSHFISTVDKHGDKYASFNGCIITNASGPAITRSDGSKEWFLNGVRHREDGPAIEGPLAKDSDHIYWLWGVPLTPEEFSSYRKADLSGIIKEIQSARELKTNGWVKILSPTSDEILKFRLHFRDGLLHCDDGPALIDDQGNEAWFQSGLMHRVEGPALTRADGSYEFWSNGRRHRFDGPAVVGPDGSREWYLFDAKIDESFMLKEMLPKSSDSTPVLGLHGKPSVDYRDENNKLHSESGPAKIFFDGVKEWWKHGYFHRKDAPAITFPSGAYCWYNEGLLHRTDGPAIQTRAGVKKWYLNGQRHRVGGPAIERPSGRNSWYLNGKRLTKREYDIQMEKSLVVTLEDMSNEDLYEEVQRLSQELLDLAARIEQRDVEVESLLNVVSAPEYEEVRGQTQHMLMFDEVDFKSPEVKEEEMGWGLPLASMMAAALIGVGKGLKKQSKQVQQEEEQEIAQEQEAVVRN